MEQTTTTAIETQINGTPGMTYMTSTSTGSGASNITVNFDVGTDINIATLDVQNRVSVAQPSLPDAVKRLGLTVRKRNPSFMMVLAFYSPNGTHDATFIGNYVNLYVKDALSRVKGVGDIFARSDEFSMRIWLNPEKLAALGMTPADVNAALQEQNLQIAAGTVGGNPQPSAQTFEYSVLTNSRINTQTDFENIVVRTRPADGSIVHLKDVARVELGKFDYTINAFANGKPASFVLIYQAPGANVLDTYRGVNKALEELRKTFPKDIDFVIPSETATVVEVSIREVVETLAIALFSEVFTADQLARNEERRFVVKGDDDEGEPELGMREHPDRIRNPREGGLHGDGDLLLDFFRRPSWKQRDHRDLSVGDVRKRLDRDGAKRIQPDRHEQGQHQRDRKRRTQREIDDALDHSRPVAAASMVLISLVLFIRRARFVSTPGESDGYHERICLTRSVIQPIGICSRQYDQKNAESKMPFASGPKCRSCEINGNAIEIVARSK